MPKKPETNVARERIVSVRMTAEEHSQFTAAAEKDGKTLSVWFRWLAELRMNSPKKRGG